MTRKRIQSAIILAVFPLLLLLGVVLFQPMIRFSMYLHENLNLPVCLLNDLFNIRCPLCGGTRCCAALLRGDILSAVYYNPFVIVLGICFAVWYIRSAIRLLCRKTDSIHLDSSTATVLMIAVVLFTIIRNIPFYRIIFY